MTKYFCLPLLCAMSIAYGQDNASADQLFEFGEQSLAAGKYREAISYYTKCLVINARYQEAFRQRAQAKEAVSDWIGAVADYSSFLEYQPDHTETIFNRAVARYHAKQYTFALDDFNHLLTMPRGETTSVFYTQLPFGGGTGQIFTTANLNKYMMDYIGLTEYALNHMDKALACFDSAIRLDNRNADFYAHRGMAHEARQNFEAATTDYTTAISLDPDHSIAMHNLERMPVKKEKIDLEEATLTQTINRDPHLPYAYRERAFYRFSKGNHTGALEDYNKALEIDSLNMETWLNRGLVKEKLNDLPGAYSDYTKVIDLHQDNAKAWMSRANILSKMGKDNEAIEDYSIAIFYYPEYAQAYYNRAIVRQRSGSSPEACSDLQLAMKYGMTVNEKLLKTLCKP